jgi:hypothetical protein
MLEKSVGGGYYLSEERVAKLLMYAKPFDAEGLQAKTQITPGVTTHVASLKGIEKETEVATTLMACDYKGFGNQGMTGVLENSASTDNDRIIVAGTLNPEKPAQDRVRVLSDEGICQGLRATDYKDPPKIVARADGIYTQVSDDFQRGGAEKSVKNAESIGT